MDGCAFGFHRYGRWSAPEWATVPSGYSVRFYTSGVVQHRTCERCGYVDVRRLDADINTGDAKGTKSGQPAGE